MSHKRRHKAKRKKVPIANFATVEPAKPVPYRGRELWRDIMKGVLFIAIVIAITLSIEEHTTFGKLMTLMGYNYLQTQLSSSPPPVMIVDITGLPPEDFPAYGEKVTATPRKPLMQMIEAISEQHPKAIGVDIDFSPNDLGYILPDDPQFFESILDLQKRSGVPVFLGANRTITRPADEWLGSRKFGQLAANILVPRNNQQMLYTFEVTDGKEGATKEEPSRTISALLAEAYGEGNATAMERWIHRLLAGLGLVERFSEEPIPFGGSAEGFLIDYSAIDSLEDERIETTNPVVLRDSSNRRKLEGKVVLIGDATRGKATDTFVIPARQEPYPGIFVHASAAYTLIKAPLYHLTLAGHIMLDFLLSALVLLGIVLIKYRYRDAEKRDVAAEKWRGRLTLLVVLGAIVIGVVFVRITRIMWDDFFLALILLVFHPSIEHHVETVWTTIRRRVFNSEDRSTSKNERARSVTMHCLLVILSLIVILSCGSGAVAQPRAVGFIEDISGVAILKQGRKQIRLDSKMDMGRRLFPGDSIRPTRGAKLSVRIGKDSEHLDDDTRWFVVPNMVPSRSDRDPFREAINVYGRIGGRTRAVIRKSMVFSPADDSVVVPALFVIRWAPARKNCVATIEIQKPRGELLWQEKNVNSASGELNSETARRVLERYRSAADVGSLRLKFYDSCGNTGHSDFSFLPITEEISLNQELKLWDSNRDGLMNYLGRAAVFNSYRMLSQVAEEYEQALAVAPMSRDLLSRTIEAQRLIGNLIRAKELERRQVRRN
jgi:CHASE2 domain-containing sensor protein